MKIGVVSIIGSVITLVVMRGDGEMGGERDELDEEADEAEDVAEEDE